MCALSCWVVVWTCFFWCTASSKPEHCSWCNCMSFGWWWWEICSLANYSRHWMNIKTYMLNISFGKQHELLVWENCWYFFFMKFYFHKAFFWHHWHDFRRHLHCKALFSFMSLIDVSIRKKNASLPSYFSLIDCLMGLFIHWHSFTFFPSLHWMKA